MWLSHLLPGVGFLLWAAIAPWARRQHGGSTASAAVGASLVANGGVFLVSSVYHLTENRASGAITQVLDYCAVTVAVACNVVADLALAGATTPSVLLDPILSAALACVGYFCWRGAVPLDSLDELHYFDFGRNGERCLTVGLVVLLHAVSIAFIVRVVPPWYGVAIACSYAVPIASFAHSEVTRMQQRRGSGAAAGRAETDDAHLVWHLASAIAAISLAAAREAVMAR